MRFLKRSRPKSHRGNPTSIRTPGGPWSSRTIQVQVLALFDRRVYQQVFKDQASVSPEVLPDPRTGLLFKIGVIPRKIFFVNNFPKLPKQQWQGNNNKGEEAASKVEEEAVEVVEGTKERVQALEHHMPTIHSQR